MHIVLNPIDAQFLLEIIKDQEPTWQSDMIKSLATKYRE